MRDVSTLNYISYMFGKDVDSFRMARSVNYSVGSAPLWEDSIVMCFSRPMAKFND